MADALVRSASEEEEEPQVTAVVPMPMIAVLPNAEIESTPLTTAAAGFAANIVAQHLTLA